MLDQVRDLMDKLKAIQDTLESWRSNLKDHEPPHVLPKDVEAQLQQLTVSGMFVGNQMLSPRVWVSLVPDMPRDPGNKARYETSAH